MSDKLYGIGELQLQRRYELDRGVVINGSLNGFFREDKTGGTTTLEVENDQFTVTVVTGKKTNSFYRHDFFS